MAGFVDVRNATVTRMFFTLMESAGKVGLLMGHPVIQAVLQRDAKYRQAAQNAAAYRSSPLSYFDSTTFAATAEGTIMPLATFTSTPVDLATARAGERYELGDQEISRTPEFAILASMSLDAMPTARESAAIAYILQKCYGSWMRYTGKKIVDLSSTWTPAGGTSGANLTVELWQAAVDASRQAGHVGKGLGVIDATAQTKLRQNALTLGGAAMYTGWASAFANGTDGVLYPGMYSDVDILVQNSLPAVVADTAGEIVWPEDLNVIHDTPKLQAGSELIAEIPGILTIERCRGIGTGVTAIVATTWSGIGKLQDTGRKILWVT